MKSLTAVCQTGASMPPMNPNGRIARHPPQRGDGENAEMKMYLSKLKDLVPFMPKNRKLSKLEIIQHVIDYICDLQTELEAHPDIANFDAATALSMTDESLNQNNNNNNSEENLRLAERLAAEQSYSASHDQQQNVTNSSSSPALRQPLVDRQAPNTILPHGATTTTATNIVAAAHTTMAMHMQQQLQQQQQQWEQQMQQQQHQQSQQQQQTQQQQQQTQQQQHGEAVSC